MIAGMVESYKARKRRNKEDDKTATLASAATVAWLPKRGMRKRFTVARQPVATGTRRHATVRGFTITRIRSCVQDSNEAKEG